MLMTVLRGDLATRQSRALVMAFKAMKDYIVENQGLVSQRDLLRVSIQTAENTEAIRNVQALLVEQKAMLHDQKRMLLEHDDKLAKIFDQMSDTVHKSELSPVLLQFNSLDEPQEYLLLNGQPAKADKTYISIYAQAKHTVYIVDNYINIKSLRQLQNVRAGVSVTMFSDNLRGNLHASDYQDFQTEYPSIPVTFIRTGGIMHDRFIILDYDTPDEMMFHCGASAKDAAIRLTTAIMEVTSSDVKSLMHGLIDKMKGHPKLTLR